MQYSKSLTSAMILALASGPLAVRAADVETLADTTAFKGQATQQCQTDLQAFQDGLVDAGFGVLAPGAYGTLMIKLWGRLKTSYWTRNYRRSFTFWFPVEDSWE